MSKPAVLSLVALLLTTAAASASGVVVREPPPTWRLSGADADDRNTCSLPQLSIRPDSVSPRVGKDETPLESSVVENPWASGAASHWNAGVNRAVDHLLKPPEHMNVYATQTGEDLRGHFEGTNSPNETFATFEVVFH